ncbi:MAG: hypothetical protein RBR43_04320 [Desulfuromonadaceae bacterium]|jgi:hypothetical protein|nr:hypothetical protein [Desulfuromonas sp.]MDY0185090.1 hypothetical protein [Desulfuromonadaceae bacterium]
MLISERNKHWETLVNQLRRELSSIGEDEREWLQQRIALIQRLQQDLHTLFSQAGGHDICQACSGSCCGHGHNHMTLLNVAAALLAQQLPQADFNSTCPFLTHSGCSLDVSVRPFNCITFICEQIEAHMSTEQVAEFYRMEKILRAHYTEVDCRYVGSSPRGLLIGAQRLNGSPLLARNTSFLEN